MLRICGEAPASIAWLNTGYRCETKRVRRHLAVPDQRADSHARSVFFDLRQTANA